MRSRSRVSRSFQRAPRARTVILLNPRSGRYGTARGLEGFNAARELIERRLGPVRVHAVNGRTMRAATVRSLENGAKTIIAAGGDGSVSAVAGALAGSEARLGVLPLGTLNHFAKDLGLPMNLIRSAHVIAHGPERRIDLGVADGQSFINNASIGLYPRLVKRREELSRRLIHGKWTALLRASGDALADPPRMRVRLRVGDERTELRTPFVFVGNNWYRFDRRAVASRKALDEGVLGVYAARHAGRAGLMRMAARALIHRLDTDHDLLAYRTPALTVEAKPRRVAVGLDGEVKRLATPVRFRIRPAALRVLAPPRRRR